MDYSTVLLNSTHKKEQFDCSNKALNRYLHVQASQDVKRKLAVCFVMADANHLVQGYYTLSASSIPNDLLPTEIKKKLPPYKNMPVTLLGRLAVDNNHKRKKVGSFLLMDALQKSSRASHTIGSMAVVVDPIDDDARSFYAKWEFVDLPGSGKMFIAMSTIAKLFR